MRLGRSPFFFVFAALIALCAPSVAHADETTFTFNGSCTDCGESVTGTLVVQGYTPGAELGNGNFVSFTYESNLIGQVIFNQSNFAGFDAVLDSSTAPYDVTITSGYYEFLSYDNGVWTVTFPGNSNNLDFGNDGLYTLSVSATGLSGVAGLRRRRR
jgi:hypothetical protein